MSLVVLGVVAVTLAVDGRPQGGQRGGAGHHAQHLAQGGQSRIQGLHGSHHQLQDKERK